jgi:hypothetical protein
VVTVAFVRKTAALVEGVRQPFLAPHAEGAARSQPAVASVTIVGPFDPKGVESTPSRQRIFICRPAAPAAEAGCARQILSTLGRRAYRRPLTDADLAVLLKFCNRAARPPGSMPASKRRSRVLVGPEFLLRVESDRRRRAEDRVSGQRDRARLTPVVLHLEQHPGRCAARRGDQGTLRQPT